MSEEEKPEKNDKLLDLVKVLRIGRPVTVTIDTEEDGSFYKSIRFIVTAVRNMDGMLQLQEEHLFTVKNSLVHGGRYKRE